MKTQKIQEEILYLTARNMDRLGTGLQDPFPKTLKDLLQMKWRIGFVLRKVLILSLPFVITRYLTHSQEKRFFLDETNHSIITV